MPNFPIQFTHPWLLLLIIPLIGIALLLFFRVKKKIQADEKSYHFAGLTLHSLRIVCICTRRSIYSI